MLLPRVEKTIEKQSKQRFLSFSLEISYAAQFSQIYQFPDLK